MAKRTYTSGDRTFEITLAGTSRGSSWQWTVDHVFDRSINQEIRVPGMEDILASTEDAAFAPACDCLERSSRPRT